MSPRRENTKSTEPKLFCKAQGGTRTLLLAASLPSIAISFSDREMTANILFHHICPGSGQNDLTTMHHGEAVYKVARNRDIVQRAKWPFRPFPPNRYEP